MSNPWADITLPFEGKTNAKRADKSHLYDFFWAKSTIGEELFIFQCEKKIQIKEKIPKLNGIKIAELIPKNGNEKNIVISLKEKENLEIFHILCIDILNATREAKNTNEALNILYRRTWRWHQLLKKGFSGILSKQEQKGLVGELNFLSEILFEIFSKRESLSFWEGPLGSPKDFCLGKNCVEVKTKGGTAQPFISISSEFQLEKNGFDNLFLFVLNISPGIVNDTLSFTLTDKVNEIIKTLRETSPEDVDDFLFKLMEVGYFLEDDYSEFVWQVVNEAFYDVKEGFPCIPSSLLPCGVSKLSYKVDLNLCESYLINQAEVKKLIRNIY